MVSVTFRYKDSFSRGEWRTQHCLVESVEQCKKIYGLGEDPDCIYEITKVEEV